MGCSDGINHLRRIIFIQFKSYYFYYTKPAFYGKINVPNESVLCRAF